jgi:hypothetical protein
MTDLIVDIRSNFFMVDSTGYVQLAHLSVREYLEAKKVGVAKYTTWKRHTQKRPSPACYTGKRSQGDR